MQFDPNNPIVKLCAQGMEQEMAGRPALAKQLYHEAWEKAIDDTDKFTAAHYLARQQDTVADKLKWDETALALAQRIDSPEIKTVFPSLYLNVAKCYEDMGNPERARKNYLLAQSFTHLLGEDGYGKMIRAGIEAGLQRVSPSERS